LKKYDDRDCTKFASYMQFELRGKRSSVSTP
jgi:hypothetical protein